MSDTNKKKPPDEPGRMPADVAKFRRGLAEFHRIWRNPSAETRGRNPGGKHRSPEWAELMQRVHGRQPRPQQPDEVWERALAKESFHTAVKEWRARWGFDLSKKGAADGRWEELVDEAAAELPSVWGAMVEAGKRCGAHHVHPLMLLAPPDEEQFAVFVRELRGLMADHEMPEPMWTWLREYVITGEVSDVTKATTRSDAGGRVTSGVRWTPWGVPMLTFEVPRDIKGGLEAIEKQLRPAFRRLRGVTHEGGNVKILDLGLVRALAIEFDRTFQSSLGITRWNEGFVEFIRQRASVGISVSAIRNDYMTELLAGGLVLPNRRSRTGGTHRRSDLRPPSD